MVAMAGIVIIVIAALSMGFDGVILMTGIAIISGLGGYPVLAELKKGLPVLKGQSG